MVLLTSNQAQVVLSSAIIFSFTLLLFLSGYVIQQRSIEGLHSALRPRAPLPRHNHQRLDQDLHKADHTSINRYSRPLGRIKDRLKWQKHLLAADEPFPWNKYAYAQLVKDHAEVCHALILFADLHRMKSPAVRLLLFPQHWWRDVDGEAEDQALETSRRLIKKAARRYQVSLVPIGPNVRGKKEEDPNAYSIASLAGLYDFHKIMTFPRPALVLDAHTLDSLLAFAETDSIAAYPALSASKSATMLIVPSASTVDLLTKNAIEHIDADVLLPDPSDASLFSTPYALRTADPHTFNATEFTGSTALMHFIDPDLPGPDYDIPYGDIVKMRPVGNDDQSFLWEKMYSSYKDRRYRVCGLDLEVWPPLPEVRKIAVGARDRVDL